MERAWSGAPQRPARAGRHSILLVEPDAFARRMMAPLLAAAGYYVTVVSGLHEARDAAQMGAQYAAIVGDPGVLDTLSSEGHWTEVPRLGVGEHTAATASTASLAAIMRPSDRGGLIAALDRAARGSQAA